MKGQPRSDIRCA